MRKIVTDLFTSNPAYAKTPLYPWDIIEPIGYNSLRHSTIIDKPKTRRLELFQFPEEQLSKTTFNRRGLENEAMLEVSFKQAKTSCISGGNLTILEDRQAAAKEQLARVQWFPEHPEHGDTSILQFMEVLSCLPKERLFTIEDYTLSHYCYFLETANPNYELYLNELVNREFIEYKVNGMHITNSQFPAPNAIWQAAQAVNIENRDQVRDLIQRINKSNADTDPNYRGLHLFIGLRKLENPAAPYQECESKFLPILQYYSLLLSGTLADGQCAILRIYSNIKHKTNEFLFLLRTMFTRIIILKPLTSSLLLHEKYLVCEGFKKAAGLKINEHLYKHYDLLKQHGELVLLVRSADIFKSDFHQSTQDFNNILVNTMLKPLYERILGNSGAIYVLNFTALLTKLKNLWSKYPVEGLIAFLKANIRFEDKPLSQLKLSAPAPVQQTNSNHYQDRHDRHHHRPYGNTYHREQPHQRRPFSGERRPYHHHQDRR